MEKIIKKLESELAFAVDSNEPMDEASWNDQYGMLITYNEAKAILEALKAFKISSNVPVISSVCEHR